MLVVQKVLPTQPGAPQASPYSLMAGFSALACSISHQLYPALQLMEPDACSMLDSEPSVELVSPPISTLRICRSAPYPGLNR